MLDFLLFLFAGSGSGGQAPRAVQAYQDVDPALLYGAHAEPVHEFFAYVGSVHNFFTVVE